MYLWIRCGDADNYHEFDGLDEAADYLTSCRADPPLRRCQTYGLTDDLAYRGRNYISCFWAEDASSPMRELAAAELDELNLKLNATANER